MELQRFKEVEKELSITTFLSKCSRKKGERNLLSFLRHFKFIFADNNPSSQSACRSGARGRASDLLCRQPVLHLSPRCWSLTLNTAASRLLGVRPGPRYQGLLGLVSQEVGTSSFPGVTHSLMRVVMDTFGEGVGNSYRTFPLQAQESLFAERTLGVKPPEEADMFLRRLPTSPCPAPAAFHPSECYVCSLWAAHLFQPADTWSLKHLHCFLGVSLWAVTQVLLR